MGIRLPIWTIIFLAFHFSTIAETNGKKPNILICISENHAIRFLANSEELGTSINPTPYLSRISQVGELHPLAYCTNASPSYTAFSLLTGKSKSTQREDFDSSQFLSQHFKTIGYETVFFGSWTWDNDPNHAGFDFWKILDDPEIFINPRIKDSKNQYVTEGHTTDVITDLAIQWVNKRSETKPFFALVSFQATKRPWIPPIRTIDKYNADWFDTPETFSSNLESRAPANKYQNMNIGADLDLVLDLFLPSYADLNSSKSTPSIWSKNWESMNDEQKTAWGLSWKPQNEAFSRESPQGDLVSIWMFQRFIKNYLRCLYAMDENIGRLIDSIDSKVKEGYNFIYTSERGRFTGEFGWFGSEWMYEPSARIPMVFANFKGLSAPAFKKEEIFRDFDLYFLIKNLVKPKTSGPTQIIPQPNSTRIGNNQFYFSNLDHPGESGVSPHHGLRKGKYKIVHYYPFDEWEFFDLENDPQELQNLYNNVTHSTVVSEYKEYLNNAGEFTKNKRDNQLFSETWKRKQRSPENKKR